MKKNKRYNSMRDLLKSYSIVLILVISTFGILLSVVTTQQVRNKADTEVTEITKALSNVLENYQIEARRITYDLFSTPEERDDLNYYFLNDFIDYSAKNLHGEYIFFPKKISNLYLDYPALNAVSIQLKSSNDTYISTLDNRFGTLNKEFPSVDDSVVFSQTIINPNSHEVLGQLNIYIDTRVFDQEVSRITTDLQASVAIVNGFDTLIYENNLDTFEYSIHDEDFKYEVMRNEIIDKSRYIKSQFSNEYQVIAFITKNTVNMQAFSTYAMYLAIAIILDILLLLVLHRIFGDYTAQVEDILEFVSEVKDGEYGSRIDTIDKNTELSSIANGINEMLNSITDYIDTIYQLEIRQRDISLMALQSQINPHFLYNTLEFIRMYAVSEGVDELAEIVFSFSELLRNNISLERETTLAKEIEFTENYIYLYQMRYPNRLAYKVSIEEDLKNIILPKFTLQPLIENYIKHGVDFNRIDNAIHINIYKLKEVIQIGIFDNGRGTSQASLDAIKKRLSVKEIDIKSDKSIGLYNVHERLKAYFKEAYNMEIYSEPNRGFQIFITLDATKGSLQSKLKEWSQ